MFSSTTTIIKVYTLVGLAVLVTGLLLGNVNLSFAVEPMVGDIEMWIDTSEKFDDEAEMFNNFLNVFTAVFLASEGNVEVVVMDRNTICISARTGGEGCSGNISTLDRHALTDVESHESGVTILSTYDE